MFVSFPVIAFFLGESYGVSMVTPAEVLSPLPYVQHVKPTVVPVNVTASPSVAPTSGTGDFYSLPLQKTACIPGPIGPVATLSDGSQVYKLNGKYIRTMGNMCD